MSSKEEADAIQAIFSESEACSDCVSTKQQRCSHRVCPMCLEQVNVADIAITKCKHMYCKACMTQLEKTQLESVTSTGIVCPCCRAPIEGYHIISEESASMFAWIMFEGKPDLPMDFQLTPLPQMRIHVRRPRTFAGVPPFMFENFFDLTEDTPAHMRTSVQELSDLVHARMDEAHSNRDRDRDREGDTARQSNDEALNRILTLLSSVQGTGNTQQARMERQDRV